MCQINIIYYAHCRVDVDLPTAMIINCFGGKGVMVGSTSLLASVLIGVKILRKHGW